MCSPVACRMYSSSSLVFLAGPLHLPGVHHSFPFFPGLSCALGLSAISCYKLKTRVSSKLKTRVSSKSCTKSQPSTDHLTLYRWCTVVSATSKYIMINPRLKMEQPKCDIFNRGSSYLNIWMLQERPCFICFVVWPTTSLKYDFVS